MEKKRESKIENPEEMLSLDKLVPNAGGEVSLFWRVLRCCALQKFITGVRH